jgi:hypothetical protein
VCVPLLGVEGLVEALVRRLSDPTLSSSPSTRSIVDLILPVLFSDLLRMRIEVVCQNLSRSSWAIQAKIVLMVGCARSQVHYQMVHQVPQ